MNRDPFTDKTAAKWPEPAARPSMLASRGFWIGGALSVAIWVALALIFWGWK